MIGLIGFAIIIAAGIALKLPRGGLWGLVIFWWLIAVVTTSPFFLFGNPNPPVLGGNFVGWVMLGPAVATIMGYKALLRKVKSKAVVVPAAAVSTAFRSEELDRYARHIMLREIGGPGQRRLKDARVLVIGAGGLGSSALLYLAAAGVGVIGVIDDDLVDASNLQRQIIHTDQRIGLPKVQSAEVAIKALNPFVEVRPYQRRLTEEIAAELIGDYDLILDGTDNFDTRYLVNRMAVAQGKPLISAAMTQWEGQISLYDPRRGSPCYECVFPTRPAPGLVPSCAEAGVAAPLPGIIGSLMAMEAVKEITGAGEGLRGRMMIFDALYADSRVIKVARRAGCAVCGGLH